MGPVSIIGQEDRMKKYGMIVCAIALVCGGAFAQNSDIEALSGVQFDFGNPGARAMGMGGAFLGLADDASAAEANPAGLTILRTPEISLEVRHFLMQQDLPVTGTVPDIVDAPFKEWSRTAEIQFASIVFPLGNWAIAGYYHHPVNYSNAGEVLPEVDVFGQVTRPLPNFFFSSGDPIGSVGPISFDECVRRQDELGELCFEGTVFPFVTAVEIDLKTMGLSLAWETGPLSLGATARYQRLRQAAFTTRADPVFFEPTSVLVQATFNEEFEPDWEDDLTFAAGFKWVLRDGLSFGGVYKQGPEFPAPVFLGVAGQADFDEFADVMFNVPDSYGVGLSWRPTPVLTINLDAIEVKYSDLSSDLIATTAYTTASDFRAKDATELRIGGEYFFTTRIPVAIRAGYWEEPGHALEYVGPSTCTDVIVPENERINCVAQRITAGILFPESEDQDHMSIGIGLAWPTFQIDAAYDTSDKFKVGSITAVYRF